MKPVKIFFDVIQNAERTRIEWTQQAEFIHDNCRQYFFGEIAKQAGEAPIKAVFTFKNDGNIQGLRGDKYTGKPIDMLKNLHKLCRQYFNENKVHEVKIYDNRDLLPVKTRLVLHWHENKGTLINFLPIYSGEFDLKPVKK